MSLMLREEQMGGLVGAAIACRRRDIIAGMKIPATFILRSRHVNWGLGLHVSLLLHLLHIWCEILVFIRNQMFSLGFMF